MDFWFPLSLATQSSSHLVMVFWLPNCRLHFCESFCSLWQQLLQVISRRAWSSKETRWILYWKGNTKTLQKDTKYYKNLKQKTPPIQLTSFSSMCSGVG